jgi:hypothetical protein
MAAGRRPFAGSSAVSTLHAVLHHQPTPPRDVRPDVPASLSDLIMRLLAKEPGDRPASAREVAHALTAIAGGVSPAVPGRRGRQWRAAAAVGAIALTLGAAVLMVNHLRRRPTANAPVTVRAPILAAVDIRVWRPGPDGSATRLRLTEPGAPSLMPLKPGDQFRIEATTGRPAYLYLFWIDTEGKTVPVYPWQPGKWGTRPAEEQAVVTLELPPTAAKGYTISGDQPGMETLVLVARTERLDLPDDQIQGWFAGLPAQRPFQDAHSAVWFENGRIVTGDNGRRQRGFEEADINDPVLRVQGLLKERIGPHAAGTAAVSFARLGQRRMP